MPHRCTRRGPSHLALYSKIAPRGSLRSRTKLSRERRSCTDPHRKRRRSAARPGDIFHPRRPQSPHNRTGRRTDRGSPGKCSQSIRSAPSRSSRSRRAPTGNNSRCAIRGRSLCLGCTSDRALDRCMRDNPVPQDSSGSIDSRNIRPRRFRRHKPNARTPSFPPRPEKADRPYNLGVDRPCNRRPSGTFQE